MQVNVAGKLWVQAIPTADLAPYVKQQIMMTNRWCAHDSIRLLAALCEGPTPLRRIWKLREYQRFVKEELLKLDINQIEALAQKDSRIAEAVNATGILNAFNQSLQGYGRTLGDVGQGNFGAAGSFVPRGLRRSRDMEGAGYCAASPQFGSTGVWGYGG
jgi:hypothetical protein